MRPGGGGNDLFQNAIEWRVESWKAQRLLVGAAFWGFFTCLREYKSKVRASSVALRLERCGRGERLGLILGF